MGREATINPLAERPVRTSWRIRTGRWAIPALLLAVALALRLSPLNLYVTPDEPAWALRAIQFRQALATRDLDGIPATGHPGVTTMWLGALGVQVQLWLNPAEAAAHLEWLDGLAGLSPESPAAYPHLRFFIPTGRVLVALVTSLGLLALFGLVHHLWGRAVALLAASLLALDPFLIGHSGLLHLDGLLATGMLLSVLTALVAIQETRPLHKGEQETLRHPYRWITLSGLLGGMALLTKTPAGVLAPFVTLLLVSAGLTNRLRWRQVCVALILWGAAAAATFFVLYPALWSAPVTTLRGLLDVGGRHVEGALRPVFFQGRFTYDPSSLYYPVVAVFRASPLVLIGGALAMAAYLRRSEPRRFAAASLLALAVGFGLLVTLVGKKHDRYLLPALPPLTLVAALGWAEFGRWVKKRSAISRLLGGKTPATWAYSSSIIVYLFIAALILIQLALILPFLTAPLGYFNPLLGGPAAAQEWLEIGWGEGEGAAARWLNQLPDAPQVIVATPSIPPFASLFVGQTVELDQGSRYQADYILRPPAQSAVQLPWALETAETVYEKRIGGISYGGVSHNAAPVEQAHFLEARTLPDDLILLDAEAALTRAYEGPAQIVSFAKMGTPAEMASGLEELLQGRERVWYVAHPAASPITADHLERQLACRGRTVSADPIAGVTISQILLGKRTACDETGSAKATYTLRGGSAGDLLAVVDTRLPGSPTSWPNPLPVLVRWEALAPLEADYRAVLYLVDEAGHTWVEGGREILDGDYRRPSAWSPDDWSDQTFRLEVPAGIPPGGYRVELGVFDPLSGTRLSVWEAGEAFAGLSGSLGPVTIAPPAQPPTAAAVAMAQRLEPALAAGPLRLLGYNPPPERIEAGERVAFDLFWTAAEAPGADFALRWGLALPDGGLVVSDTVAVSPHPTGQWRAGELERVRYDLQVPSQILAGVYDLVLMVMDATAVPLWNRDHTLAQVSVAVGDRQFDLPANIAYPLDYRLGDLAHLRGFDVGSLLGSPGDRLPLTLYWQAQGSTELGYSVFIHLVGPDGMIHGQQDRPPVDGAAPTYSWVPGQVIIDQASLPVLTDAPPGAYHIAVGLYDPVSADRLPVYDGAGQELPNGQLILPVEVTVK